MVQRKSNIELLRIFAAWMIVSYHVACGLGYHPFLSETHFSPLVEWTSIIFGSWGILGVDLFWIISAYFMQDQNFRSKKILTIVFQVLCFELLFTVAEFGYTCVHQGVPMGCKTILLLWTDQILQPLWSQDYWFFTTYIFLYILSPWLNQIIQLKSEIQLRKLLIILSFIPFYSNFWVGTPPVANIVNFVYIYLLVGYLKKWNQQAWIENHAWQGMLCISISVILSQWLYHVFPSQGVKGMIRNFLPYITGNINRHSAILWLDALFIFYAFKNLKIKSSKIINLIVSCTLGIYLFHENPVFVPMKDLVKKFFITSLGEATILKYFPTYFFLSTILLFMMGFFVEYIRKNVLDKYVLPNLIKKCSQKIERTDHWFEKI